VSIPENPSSRHEHNDTQEVEGVQAPNAVKIPLEQCSTTRFADLRSEQEFRKMIHPSLLNPACVDARCT
jgi:hypothetical protein